MDIKEIGITDSTNNYVRAHEKELAGMTMVRAVCQTGGRGQRGNSWEAEPGKNLTFTVLYRPDGMEAGSQFSISEAVATGVVSYLAGRGIEAKVKWPNDVYVGDRKICGILIEHSVMGREIEYSILGVGINVNQLEFISDAPNPVSMARLTGKEYDLREEAEAIGTEIEKSLGETRDEPGRRRLHESFLDGLWRADGAAYEFRDVARDTVFRGIIRDVERNGILVMEDIERGGERRYAFKEVEFLIRGLMDK